VDPTSYLGVGGPVLSNLPKEGDPSQASGSAFKKYVPQWSVMPRISFSFPVSTNSLFYAHYNIITIRPTNLQVDPVAYLYIDRYKNAGDIINNPNLRPYKSVDYEIGFRQKVGENAALNIGAYYSEKRDQIQSYRFTCAYPKTYYSYENQDFGTVQGFMLEMTMRGTKNLTFRASYTLQFAKGTGSSSGSNLAIIASGQPNLRTLTNLSFDQRHRISANIDLRFDNGVNYNGPITVKQKKGTDTKKEIRWFENAGINLLLSAASGMPYSRAGRVFSELGWTGNAASQLQGSINGASTPWTFQCDLRIEKAFLLNLASKKDNNEGGKRNYKPGFLRVYLDFANLLNLKNVQSVYDYTGSAKSDGYLSSSLFQIYQASGVAFSMPFASAQNYYQMRIANPYNYTQPFRVYLGLEFSF
jgi:outer membrane receptor protein involved in Fe transport